MVYHFYREYFLKTDRTKKYLIKHEKANTKTKYELFLRTYLILYLLTQET